MCCYHMYFSLHGAFIAAAYICIMLLCVLLQCCSAIIIYGYSMSCEPVNIREKNSL